MYNALLLLYFYYLGVNNLKLTQKEALYNQFKSMTDEQLKEIIADNEYEEVAKEVARDILNSDRKEYLQRQEEIKQAEQHQENIQQEKYQAQQTNPLYDDIHQMAKDIRFMRNLIIALLCFSVVVSVIILILAKAV